MQKVFISILHYNNTQDTKACLDSLLRADFTKIEIITFVLDNGSSEALMLDEEDYKKIGLHVIVSHENLGFTGGHNYIFESVSNREFDYFLILNNDLHFDKDFLNYLIDPLVGEDVGAAVPKIYFTKGHEYHKSKYKTTDLGKVIWYAGGYIDWRYVQSVHAGLDEVDTGKFDLPKHVDFATGACLLIKKEVIKKIGLFDRKYFLYYEDADLSWRIIKSGYSIAYQPRALVWHNNAGSSGSGSDLHDYYLTRNKLLFGMTYAPFRMKLFLLKEGLTLLLNGRKWQKIGALDYFLKRFGKGSFKKV